MPHPTPADSPAKDTPPAVPYIHAASPPRPVSSHQAVRYPAAALPYSPPNSTAPPRQETAPAPPAERSPRRIDEPHTATIQQAVLVIDNLLRRALIILPIRRHHPLRPERPHMQPHRRAARSAVIQKRPRPHRARVLLEVRHIKHPRRRQTLIRLIRITRLLPLPRPHLTVHSHHRVL